MANDGRNYDNNDNDDNNNDNNDNNDECISVSIHKIVSIMANMLNYLNVSLYEGQFTYNHEQARLKINEIYDSVSKTPLLAPSLDVTAEFYNNVKYLKNVTDTDDLDYYQYMRELRNYFMMVL